MKGMQKIKRGTGFRGAVSYAIDREPGQEPGQIIGGNMSGTTPRELAGEFGASRQLRPEIEKPVWHNSLRLPQGDHLEPAKLAEIADDYMLRMGFSDLSQRVYVMHDDKDGQHVHIIASRVALDGSVYLGRNENLESTKQIQELERTHDLTITRGPSREHGKIVMPSKSQMKKGEIEMAVNTGKEPARQQLQRLVDAAKMGKPTAPQFCERLGVAGVTAIANVASTGRMNGFSFEMNGVAFKGSQLGARYKWGSLQKEVQYEQARDSQELERFSPSGRNRIDNEAAAGEHGELATGRASKESSGRPSPGDRTVSTSNGSIDGRHERNVGRDQSQESGTGRSVSEPNRDRHPSNEQGNEGGPGGSRSHGQSEQADGFKELQSNRDDRDIYGGSRQRILALSGTSGSKKHVGLSAGGRASEARPDRSISAVMKQIEAFGVEHFEVGIREAKTGKMMNREWSRGELMQSAPWLKRMNARGNDIYVRPAGNHGLVLVDDLKPGVIERMKQDGFTPAAQIETSPGNYQVWVKFSDQKLSAEVRNIAAKGLAKQYGGDPNSADAHHYGRLAGYTNQKQKHTRNGRQPYVLAHDCAGNVAVDAPRCLTRINEGIDRVVIKKDQDERTEAIKTARTGYGSTRSPTREYQQQAKRLIAEYGTSIDLSKMDWMIAKDMAESGRFTEVNIVKGIVECSPNIQSRKAGHIENYAKRTVEKVFDLPEVQRSRKMQAERSQDRGMSL